MYFSYIMKFRMSHFISNTLENQWFDVQPIVCSFQSRIAISFIKTVDIATCFSYLYANFRLRVIKKWYKTCIINYVCQVQSRLSSLTQWRSAKGSACELCMQTNNPGVSEVLEDSHWNMSENDKASICTELAGKKCLGFSFDSSSK